MSLEFEVAGLIYRADAGYGVIADYERADHGPVQGLLFETYVPGEKENAKAHVIPPVAAARKRRRKSRGAVLPGIFDDEPPMIPSPVPDFPLKLQNEPREEITEFTLKGGRLIAVPKTLEELAQRYGLRYLNHDTLFFDSEQARAIALVAETNYNLAFEADTGFGKTITELLLIDLFMSRGQYGVTFVPFDSLVKQFERDANLYFNFPENRLLFLSGETHNPKQRRAIYESQCEFSLIVTPEIFLNDLDAGHIAPAMFHFRCNDEIHFARGKYASVEVQRFMKEVDQQRDVPSRVFGFTATIPHDPARVSYIVDNFGFEHAIEEKDEEAIHRLFATPRDKFRKRKLFDVDPESLEVATLLYNGAHAAAISAARSLEAAVSVDHGQLASAVWLDKFRKITKIVKGQFDIPAYGDINPIRDKLSALTGQFPRRYADSYKRMCLFGYYCHLYWVLTCFGKYSFMLTVAESIWAVKFPGALPSNRKEKRKFIKMILSDSYLLDAYDRLAGETLFATVRDAKTLYPLRLKLAKSPEEKRQMAPQTLWKRVKEAILEEAVQRDYVDHSIETYLFKIVRRHVSFGYREQVIVYSNFTKHVPFLARRIERALADIGVKVAPFVGKKYGKTQRRGVLEAFRSEQVQVLVGTSTIGVGLDSNANVEFMWSQESDPGNAEQIEGRVGRKGPPGLIYSGITRGTRDAIRHYRGNRNRIKREKQKSRRKQ